MNKYKKLKILYGVAKRINAYDAIKIILSSDDEYEKYFFTFILNMNLQRSQKETIEKNLF